MALANLIVKIGADIAELKTGSDTAIRTMEKTSQRIDSIANTVGKSLLAGFSVGAVVNFGRSVFDLAGEIGDMSQSLGISSESLQRFAFAAEQSGGTMDAVVKSIDFMNRALAAGDKSTVKALRDAGLSFQDIRNLKPDQAFQAIAEAVRGISDPMLKAQVRTELFGKASASLGAAIDEGIGKVGANARVMSDETITALKDAQDAWDRLEKQVTIVSGNIIGKTLNATEEITGSWTKFAKFVNDSMKLGTGSAFAMAGAFNEASKSSKKLGDVNLPLPNQVHKTADELAAEAKAAAEAQRAIDAHNKAIQALRDKYSGQAIAKQVRDLSEAMRGLKANADWAGLAEDIGKLSAEGARLTPQMYALAASFGTLTPKAVPLQDVLKDLSYVAINDAEPAIFKTWKTINELAPDPAVSGIENLRDVLARLPGVSPETMLKGVKRESHDAGRALSELSQAFANLAQVANGGLGDVVRTMGTLVTSLETAYKGFKAFEEGKKAFSGGETLAGLASITAGITGIASAAISAGKAIAGLFDRNKGRDLVEDFAATFRTFNLDTMGFNPGGGFNELHNRLLELGVDGEKMWIALTQGVGRNNPEQAQAVIDLITKALSGQKKAIEDTGTAASVAAQSQSDAFQKARDAISSLDGQIKSLSDSIAGEAPEEFMGIVEQQTRARIDALTKEREAAGRTLEDLTSTLTDSVQDVADAIRDLPRDIEFHVKPYWDSTGSNPDQSSTPGYATGTRGAFVDFGAGRDVRLHGRERVVTEGEDLGVGGGDTYVYIGNEAIDSRLIRVARTATATGRLRTRATPGRSY